MRIHETMVPQKGQIASLDTMIAVVVTLSMVTATAVHQHGLLHGSVQAKEKMKLRREVYEATESLVTTPGKPPDWHRESSKTPDRIGLTPYRQKTVKNHEVSEVRLEALKRLPLNTLKKGLGLEEQEISLEIEELDGEVLMKKGSLDKGEVQITRITLYGGEVCEIELRAK